MVRPIEITDALSKAQQVGRLVQNALMRPEAAQEVEKAQNEKRHTQQTHTANPVPETDQVVLHVDEQERKKQKTAEDQAQKQQLSSRDLSEDEDEDEDTKSNGHIDITI